MTRTIWTVRNGRILEVRDGNLLVKVEPALDLARLQQQGCTLQDVEGYLNVTKVVGWQNEAPIEASQVLEAFEEPKKRNFSEERKREIVEKIAMAKRGETPPDSYRLPSHLKVSCPYTLIPKDMPDMMYGVMEQNEITSPRAIYHNPGWKWSKSQTMMIPGVLNYWQEVGVVKKLGRGQYQLTWPSESLREFAKRKGVEITPEDIRNKFWVPERIARQYLERLTQEGFLKKHVRHDEWNVAHVPDIAVTKPNGGEEKKHVQTASYVAPRPKYDPSEFKFKKVRIKCAECGHNFGHAYYRGNYHICQHCYQSVIGGSTAHGKEATIAKE